MDYVRTAILVLIIIYPHRGIFLIVAAQRRWCTTATSHRLHLAFDHAVFVEHAWGAEVISDIQTSDDKLF